MKHASSKQVVQKLLAQLDVQIDGNRPWDIQVKTLTFMTGFWGEVRSPWGKLYGRLVGV